MNIHWIGFDADDTLWDYEILYHRVKPEILDLFGGQHDREVMSAILDETEIRNLPLYGYGVKSFALSVIETLAEHSRGPIDPTALQKLVALFKGMLDGDLPINQHAAATLAALQPDYRLMLLTKGELSEQERKIERSGLARYFEAIEILSQKTPDSYRRVLERHAVEPPQFLMVGNSLKSDVLPVIAVGGRAVYIPHEHTWSHETLPESEQGEGYARLEHLGQLPGYLKELLGS